MQLEVWSTPYHLVNLYSYPINFNPSAWNHVTYSVRAGAPVKLYINGQTYTLGHAPTLLDKDSGLRTQIGYEPTYGMWMNGKLDEIRIYNRVLSPADLNAAINSR